MLHTNRLFGITLMAFFVMPVAAAQDSDRNAASQQGSLNLMVFKDVYGSDGLDMRRKILKDIQDAVARGNTSDEIYAALEYMSMEGLKIKSTQLKAGYAEIRKDVAEQLGSMGTERAVNILIQLCNAETNIDVRRATITALGDIGINENGNTVKIILWKVRGYNQRPPDSDVERIILSAIDAFDKIDKKNNGIVNQSREVQEFLDNVSRNERFPRRQGQASVQEHAKQVLEEMRQRDMQRRQEK
jgi:HEAT repeat protein